MGLCESPKYCLATFVVASDSLVKSDARQDHADALKPVQLLLKTATRAQN
jgi:hypothetical protein